MTALIWIYRDMRVRDNLALRYVLQNDLKSFAVVFEPPYSSIFQKKFFWESVDDFRKALSGYQIPLLVLDGKPDDVLPRLIKENKIDCVLTEERFNWRERLIQHQVEERIRPANLKQFSNRTLLDVKDLTFDLQSMPLVFTSFRKKVEQNWRVPLPVERPVEKPAGLTPKLPTGLKVIEEPQVFSHVNSAFGIRGGESEAWKRLDEYLWQTQSLLTYKDTRNGMLKKNDSSKLSPYLANGSISPRSIYYEIKKFEIEHKANESTYWYVFELLWRDYFKFLSQRVGPQLFDSNGISNKKIHWKQDQQSFHKWCSGETGVDFVDANMKEMIQTGWMSNRGRQNVASYLAKGIELDWCWGAKWFENNLIDDDPESNWGNWMYVAGVGTDPRDRMFNIQRQAELYDASGEYRNKWLGAEYAIKKASLEKDIL